MRASLAWKLVVGVLCLLPTPSSAGTCPVGIDVFPVTAAHFTLLTSPDVLNHLPGPTPEDLGDERIGTADDGLVSEPSIFGAPNDLGRARTGLPGSPGTRPLHGSSPVESQESALHAPEAPELSLARPGEGAFSYLRFEMGRFRSLSYLGGGVTGIPDDLRGGQVPVFVAQVTLGATTLVPEVLFQGPLNLDLVNISPGEDRRFDTNDDVGEEIARGCNGLTPGTDGVEDWFALGAGPFPKRPMLRRTNLGELDPRSARANEPSGRTFHITVDVLGKVPSSALFFVSQNMRLAGYGFPLGEAEGILTPGFHPDGNLPDIPGFPGSGQGLARYIHDVIVPHAQQRGDPLIGFLRGTGSIEIVGVPAILDFTLVATGTFDRFDLCTLDVPSCS